MRKVRIFACLLAVFAGGGLSIGYAMLPSTQWLSTEVRDFPCANFCFDPESGYLKQVTWWGSECDWGLSTCRPLDCNLSCRDLIRLGIF